MNYILAILVVILMINKCFNHIMYTYDICLMAPVDTSMHNLFDICHDFGTANDILLIL